jgi:hypothetical protein
LQIGWNYHNGQGYKTELIYDSDLGGNSIKFSDPNLTAVANGSGVNIVVQPRYWQPVIQGTVTVEQKVRATGTLTSGKSLFGFAFINGLAIYGGPYPNRMSGEWTHLVYGATSHTVTSMPTTFTSGQIYTFKCIYTPGATRTDPVDVEIYIDNTKVLDMTFPALPGPWTLWNQAVLTAVDSGTPTAYLTSYEMGPCTITCNDSKAMTVSGVEFGPWMWMEQYGGVFDTDRGQLGGVWTEENSWDCVDCLTVGPGWRTRAASWTDAYSTFTGKLPKMYVPIWTDNPTLNLLGEQRYGSLHVHIEDGNGNLVSDGDIANNSTGFTPTSKTTPLTVDLSNVRGEYIQVRIDGTYDGTIADLDTYDPDNDETWPWCERTPSILTSAYIESTLGAYFGLPTVYLTSSIVTPTLVGYTDGMLTVPTASYSILTSAPSLIGYSVGAVTMPQVELSTQAYAPYLAGGEAGLFGMPVVSMASDTHAPSLSGSVYGPRYRIWTGNGWGSDVILKRHTGDGWVTIQ